MKIGIYKIFNKENNNTYIGSSVGINKRFINHKSKLNKNKHHNPHLQNAWNNNVNRKQLTAHFNICINHIDKIVHFRCWKGQK